MTEPSIFQEPPPDIDETWTHGALLGGMCGYDNDSLADQYFRAARVLIDHVASSGERGHNLIGPVLYLIRHATELSLKIIVRPQRLNHDLIALLDLFRQHVRQKYKEEVPDWLASPILNLAKVDPTSDAFRYGQSRSGGLRDGEYWIDFRTLGRTTLILQYCFERVAFADQLGVAELDKIAPMHGRAVLEDRDEDG